MAYEVWKGLSAIDGSTEIVLLLSGNSDNDKTGDQLQSWILRTDMPPHEAVKTDMDDAVCGDRCIHRKRRSCYVLTWQAPYAVWFNWKFGGGNRPPPQFYTRGRSLRLASYGELPAVPFEVAEELIDDTRGHTGFTSLWEVCDPRYARLLMASVSSIEEAKRAQAMGWRTYRTAPKDWHKVKGESLCPASEEGGKKLTCATCGFCNGNTTKLKGNVVIPVHGQPYKQKRFEAGMQPQQQLAGIPIRIEGDVNHGIRQGVEF